MPMMYPTMPLHPHQVKTYHVEIKNMQFSPSHLRVEKGSTVVWQVKSDTTPAGSNSSMFYDTARSHILFFEEILVESPKLQLNKPGANTFSLSFKDAGMFSYGCCIFPRMRACIEVVETDPRMMSFMPPTFWPAEI